MGRARFNVENLRNYILNQQSITSLVDPVYLGVSDAASNALKLNGYSNSTNESLNTIVQRDSSGYVNAAYFNSTGSFSTSALTTGIVNFIGTNGTDTYARSYSADAARTAMGAITRSDYVTPTLGGTIKARVVGDTVYITTDGTDA